MSGHIPQPSDICTVCGNGLVHIDATLDARDERPARDVERLPLLMGALRFYGDQMPAYAAAAGLNREEYAAVMVDVKAVREWLATLSTEPES